MTATSVLVTGAGSGIGAACAARFAADGAVVTCADRDGDAGAAVAAALDGAGSVRCDVTDDADCAAAVAAAVTAGGGLDVVVTCAGVEVQGLVGTLTTADFARMVEVNLIGTYRTVSAAVGAMPDSGRIVLIGSINASVAFPGQTGYAASKGGVAMLGKALAVDLAPRGIRVNTVHPGITDTPMSAASLRDPERGPRYLAGIPLGRAAQPEEIAAAVAWLAAPDAGYITGADLLVDGGWLARA